MKKVLQFLSIANLGLAVVPSVTACNDNKSSFTEFKEALKTEFNKTEFKVSEEEDNKETTLKDQAQKIIDKLNQEKKYRFDLKLLNLITSKDSEFNLFFYFYKTKEQKVSSKIQSFSIKLPYKIESK